jgi:hypothetical protein
VRTVPARSVQVTVRGSQLHREHDDDHTDARNGAASHALGPPDAEQGPGDHALLGIIFLATILLVVVCLSLAPVDGTKTDHAGRLIAEPAYEAD